MNFIDEQIPSDAELEEKTRYVVLSVNRNTYAVDARFIRKVVTLTRIAPQPRIEPHILGITSVDDMVYTVMDLRVLFGEGQETVQHPSVAALIAYRGAKICAVVDSVLSVATISRSLNVQPFRGSPFIAGIIQIDFMDVNLLSLDNLFSMGNVTFSESNSEVDVII